MSRTLVFLFVLVSVVSCAKPRKPVKNDRNISKTFVPAASFKKCNRKDPKWKECFKEAAADALPQLSKSFDEVNLPSLEPLWIPQLTIVGGGSVAVTQNYKNCKIFGLSKIKLDKAE
jgi:hypothetical protein